MSEQIKQPAIAPKCENCANRIKLTHFSEGGKETYSYACVLLPLLPIITVEGVGTMVNVKDCEAFDPALIQSDFDKVAVNTYVKNGIAMINSIYAAEYLLKHFHEKGFFKEAKHAVIH